MSEAIRLATDAALALLKWNERKQDDGYVERTVHTMKQSGNMMLGCDWDEDAVTLAFNKYGGADVTGPGAQAIGHGLGIIEDGSFTAFETLYRTDEEGVLPDGAIVSALPTSTPNQSEG